MSDKQDICDEINGLVEEYRILLKRPLDKATATSDLANKNIRELLTSQGEWTPAASEHLLSLATAYGSFMLRNALALSLALQIEDGELDF